MKLIEMNIDKIIALCKKYKVAKLWVFGSILTPRFNDDSDVDFSVIFHYDQIQDLFVTFLISSKISNYYSGERSTWLMKQLSKTNISAKNLTTQNT